MGSSIVLKCSMSHYYRVRKIESGIYHLVMPQRHRIKQYFTYIYQGEALAIIGEPGASKTLLGRIIAGDIKPDRGKINKSVSTYYGDIKTNI